MHPVLSQLVTDDLLKAKEEIFEGPCACGKRRCANPQIPVGAAKVECIPGQGEMTFQLEQTHLCGVCMNPHGVRCSVKVPRAVVEYYEKKEAEI